LIDAHLFEHKIDEAQFQREKDHLAREHGKVARK